ncbi:ATP-grasp domain-containing protein [Fodinicurvata sediminis]|uniref:ATP-grasp domain-containing protein n=1 Tax=Fodinicurvata sediminis TaxID=1121832 RepID=UPI0003B365B7|nr:alpha-L-glutamate ligase [Fodinicurvata sediminis]
MSKIHVIHENDAWTDPLIAALEARNLPYASWHMAEDRFAAEGFDPTGTPPEGIFYSRMSASAHTRGNRFAPEFTASVLPWLEAHGRRVINNSRALNLEVSKLAQYAALEAAGIRTPRTLGAVGREATLQAARRLGETPFILKPNRGGTGAGVQLVNSLDELAAILDNPATEAPLDGTWLVQQYIRAAEPAITRCELIGGKFFYAVRVDTSKGFDLCPADVCEIPAEDDDSQAFGFCPAGEADSGSSQEKFQIIEGFHDPILERYAAFIAANGIEVSGIEFIRNEAGEIFTYDVNTNTNYNARAEEKAGLSGMDELARFLGRELEPCESRRKAA